MRVAGLLIVVCSVGLTTLFCVAGAAAIAGWPNRGDMLALVIFSGTALAALGLARGRRRLQVTTSIVAFVVGLYIAEAGIHLMNPNGGPRAAAARAGVPFDTRTGLQVVADLRRDGKDAYPMIGINRNRLTIGQKQGLVPLSDISKVWTVIGNESGRFAVPFSDEFGFNNPVGWSRVSQRRSIALIGDSFVQGSCVESHETMAARLGARLDPTQWQAVGVGTAGASPLSELGMIVEYLRPLKPDVVFWCFFEGNDLNKLPMEAKTSLIRYLEDSSYTQNLWTRQTEIDEFWSGWANEWIQQASEERAPQRRESGLVTWLKLGRLRQQIVAAFQEPHRNVLEQSSLEMFARILQRADDEVQSWGGRLIFVYLPSYHRFTPAGERDDTVAIHKSVMASADRQRLEVLDLYEQMFVPSGDPKSLFPFRLNGHYNAHGYDQAAEQMWLRISPHQ